MNYEKKANKEWIENSSMYQDGGVLINFNLKQQDRWDAILLKFEGQQIQYIIKEIIAE